MQIITSQEMRLLDQYTIEKLGIPALVLMENAGREAAREFQNYFQDEKKTWLILAGKGNNGGDAVVAARHLQEWGHNVQVIYAENPQHMTGDAALQCKIAEKLGIPISIYQTNEIDWNRYDGVIDGLLGTGTKGSPREPYASLIREVNQSGLPIFAMDIPSGLDADTGAVNDPCIQAVHTVTLAFLKRGLAQYPGLSAAGKVTVVPIGIPHFTADVQGVNTYLLNKQSLNECLHVDWSRPRQGDTHKGTYGHVLLVAGSRRMSGAGILSAKAAFRTGCGLVSWAVPDRLLESLIGHVPEVMLIGIADQGHGDWTKTEAAEVLSWTQGKSAVAVGPGLGQFADGSQWIQTLWEQVACPLVLDADAINLMAGTFHKWKRREAATVLTPHPGEMARLLQISTQEVQADRIETARKFAQQYQVTLVLKGAQTVVATPTGEAYVNTTGNPGMATGGTGDVLTGVIASLLAQGYTASQAACLGVYLHGYAGDQAAATSSPNNLIAGDLLQYL